MTTTVPVVRLAGVVVSVQFGQSVGVVKGADVAVLTVETDAVVPVVVTGELAVVCDSVVNVVRVVVVSAKYVETNFPLCRTMHYCISYVQTSAKMWLSNTRNV